MWQDRRGRRNGSGYPELSYLESPSSGTVASDHCGDTPWRSVCHCCHRPYAKPGMMDEPCGWPRREHLWCLQWSPSSSLGMAVVVVEASIAAGSWYRRCYMGFRITEWDGRDC
jgi:hypothetical protein